MKSAVREIEVTRIINEAQAIMSAKSNLPDGYDAAMRKLSARALSEDDVIKRRDAFNQYPGIDRTAVLANYELLHGVRYLDRSTLRANGLMHEAGAILAIFRAAEICLYNLAVLYRKSSCALQKGDFGGARVMAQWCVHFHDTLHTLSQLVLRFDTGELAGDQISIEDSPSYAEYLAESRGLHHVLTKVEVERESDIWDKDIDNNQRYVCFNEFVNCNHEKIWTSILHRVRVPGYILANNDAKEEFLDLVGCEDLRAAIASVDLVADTYLMQFRAYHQISEVLVRHINGVACLAIELLAHGGDNDIAESVRLLDSCNQLMSVVNDNIKPIARTLSPKAYFAIRPALGITSGSHSHHLRRSLFNGIYPLLVNTLRLHLVDFDRNMAEDNECVGEAASRQLREGGESQRRIIQAVVRLFQHVRLWRDDHIQFVKTQIGISPPPHTSTASISGAENAASTAQKFRMVHAEDPVAPLYMALLGVPLPSVHELTTEARFDGFMANLTASAVTNAYADVQHRAHGSRT